MKELFKTIFSKIHNSNNDSDENRFKNDSLELEKIIIDSYEKVIADFTFQLYLLKFEGHTFIDCDQKYDLIKTETPLTYQVSLSITLIDGNAYTINNVTCINVCSIEKANNEFVVIKNIIENNKLEKILNKFVFNK